MKVNKVENFTFNDPIYVDNLTHLRLDLKYYEIRYPTFYLALVFKEMFIFWKLFPGGNYFFLDYSENWEMASKILTVVWKSMLVQLTFIFTNSGLIGTINALIKLYP